MANIHVEVPKFGEGVTFYEGPTSEGSHGDWAACGPYAMGIAIAAAHGEDFTGAMLDTIISRMVAGGHFSTTGGCAPSDLIWYMDTYETGLKYTVASGIDFSGSSASTTAYHNAIIPALQAGQVTVSEWLSAHNLLYNEAGVNVHYTAQGGIDTVSGYLHMNGDRVPDNVPNAPYWMGWGYMANAQPCFLMAIEVVGSAPTSTVPSGWKDDGTTLTAPNGVIVVKGFRDDILADPTYDPTDVPQAAEFERNPVLISSSDGDGSVQYFYKTIRAWTTATGSFVVADPGKEAYVTWTDLEAANAKVAALEAQVATLESEVAAKTVNLDAQLAAIATAVNTAGSQLSAITSAAAAIKATPGVV